MKISFSIIPVIILSAFLVSSFRYAPCSSCKIYSDTGMDTVNLGSLISTDSSGIKIIPPSRGIRFYKDGIIYLASSKVDNRMIPLHESFGKINTYYSSFTDTVPGKPVLFMRGGLFPYATDGITFNSQYNVMYFSRASKDEGKYKIFRATLSAEQEGIGNRWIVDDTPLGFCSDSSVYTHPALSADSKKMVFSSDKAGTHGGMDLFLTVRTGDEWSVPVNIPGNINTKSNEGYPFLDTENNLYFSSDRAQGLGGYDIYFSRFNGQGWDDPVNLGSPVNTVYNDIAFNINNEDGHTAFYSIEEHSGTIIHPVSIRLRNTSKSALYSDLGNMFSSLLKNESVSPVIALKENQEPLNKVMNNDSGKKPQDTSGAVKPAVKTVPPASLRKNSNPPSKTTTANAVQTASDKQAKAVEKPVANTNNRTSIRTDSVSAKPEPVARQESNAETPVILYRVQILSNTRPKGSVKIKIADNEYDTYEYLYKGAYRTCVGIFKSLRNAAEFQAECRQNGYQQAFVVAFKNNIRSNDPALFKR